MPRILKLTLYKEPFDVMKTGKKPDEFREPSDWIISRLFNKDGSKREYDFIEFRNGYGKKRPFFICEYKGFEILNEPETHTYSNGLIIRTPAGFFKIKCGAIVPWTNLKS